jgi:hypothetical protein
MFPQVFLFSRFRKTPAKVVAARCAAITIIFASVVSPARLAAQMRAAQASGSPARIVAGARFRAASPSMRGFGRVHARPFGNRAFVNQRLGDYFTFNKGLNRPPKLILRQPAGDLRPLHYFVLAHRFERAQILTGNDEHCEARLCRGDFLLLRFRRSDVPVGILPVP